MFKIQTSEGGSFTFPQTLAEITLRQYIDFLTFVESTKPTELLRVLSASESLHEATKPAEKEKAQQEYDEAIEAIDDKVMYKKIYPYFARVVAFFANGITEEQIIGGKKHGDGMNVGQLEHLYQMVVTILNCPEEPEYTNVILVDGEIWHLPQRYMEKSKLIEYAEASQFEANLKDAENGNWKALPKIMCVLVRKEGEVYSEKLMKREEFFLDWTLENCLKVAFFLQKQSEKYQRNFQIYMAAQDLMNVKQESKN